MIRNIFILAIVAFAALSNAQEFPNAGFEEWVVQGNDTLPRGWTMSPFGAGRTTDAAEGTSAIRIWNWYCYAKGTLASAGIPLQMEPIWGSFYFKGHYKYILGENGGSGHGTDDSAIVTVLLRKFNTSTKLSDTVGFATAKLGPTSTYEQFSMLVPIWGPSDTLEVSFASSEQGFCTSEDCQCCYLTLDALAWAVNIGSVGQAFQPVDEPAVPNPFETETLLGIAPDGGCNVFVSNMEGIDVHEQAYRSGERIVLTSNDLPAGTYLYRIVSKDGIQSGKVIRK
jgi:hypothetical protein